MKKPNVAISVFCTVLTGTLSFGAFPVLAQDELGSGSVIIGEANEDSTKSCCGYMGVTLEELTTRLRDKAGYPHETGVLISRVETGSPADKTGLQANDIVYLVDGVKVEDSAQFVTHVRKQKAGDKVALVIYRDGKEKKITVTLGSRDLRKLLWDDFGTYSEDLSKAMVDADKSAIEMYKRSYMMRGRLGMALANLNEDLAPYFNVAAGGGVLVLSVEEKSPAAKAGIKGGDVVVNVNGTAVAEAKDITSELSGLVEGDRVSIDVVRKGIRKTFDVEMGKGSGAYELYVAPFEPSTVKGKSLEEYRLKKDLSESARLKEEVRELKARLKEMEDRLSEVEKGK